MQTKKFNPTGFITCSLSVYVFWMVMGLPADPMSTTGRIDLVEHALVGLVLAMAVGAFFGGKFLPENEAFILKPRHLLKLGLYLARLTWDILLAGIDVLVRVMRPRMNIDPAVIEVQTPLENPWTVTLNANSITLTPGTITLAVRPGPDGKGTIFTVHCLSQPNVEQIERDGGFVDRIKWIYGEENL